MRTSRLIMACIVLLATWLSGAGAARAFDMEIGHPGVVELPHPVNIDGTYVRQMGAAALEDPMYPNSQPRVHLTDPSSGQTWTVTVGADGVFHFGGLWPGHHYLLAMVDSYRYFHGYDGGGLALGPIQVGFFSPWWEMGANTEEQRPLPVTQTRVQFGPTRKVVDVKNSWHDVVDTPQQGGTFAIRLDSSNADAIFTRDLSPTNVALWHPLQLIATGE